MICWDDAAACKTKPDILPWTEDEPLESPHSDRQF